jgi:glycosyltransferase involved in cell wall biosynthesis
MKGFSIIVCCHNSSHRLEFTLKCLSQLKTKDLFDYEIIVIENGSTDDTFQVAEKYVNEDILNRSLLIERKVGKTHALTKGFSYAKYEYLVICDDDVLLKSNYLTSAFEILESNQNIGVVGGYGDFDAYGLNVPDWFEQAKGAYALGPQSKQSGDITHLEGSVWGAGMVIRKEAWTKITNAGFKNYLTGRSGISVLMAGEDTELCLLIRYFGFKVYYSEKLKYIHNINLDRINWKSILNLSEGFSRSEVYFNLYNYILFHPGHKKLPYFKILLSYLNKILVGFPSILWFKIHYATFVKNSEGYFFGLKVRKGYYQLSEIWRIRKQYNDFVQQIFMIKNSLTES